MLGIGPQTRRQSVHKLLAPLEALRFNDHEERIEFVKIGIDFLHALDITGALRHQGVPRGLKFEMGRGVPDRGRGQHYRHD